MRKTNYYAAMFSILAFAANLTLATAQTTNPATQSAPPAAFYSTNILPLVEGYLKQMNTTDQTLRQKAALAIQTLVKSQPDILNSLKQARQMPEVKSDKDVQLRNIALLVSEIAIPSKNDVWRKIITDEKILDRNTFKENIGAFGFMLSMGMVQGSIMDDYNSSMVVSEPNLTLDDFIALYGKPDTIARQPSETWYLYGPVGITTDPVSGKVKGRLRMSGFLWLIFYKHNEGKYPTELTNMGLPDIDYPFPEQKASPQK